LRVPSHIFVHNEDLYSSLASLSWKLAQRFQTSAEVVVVPEEEMEQSDSMQEDLVTTP